MAATNRTRRWIWTVATGMIALAAALAIPQPAGACKWACPPDDVITSSPRDDVLVGEVHVSTDDVVITYTDPDGQSWRVTYARREP